MHQQSRKMALCGVMTSLAMVLLLVGGLIPMATFCAPMLAMLVLPPVLSECGEKFAWCVWASVSLLGVLLVPDREVAFFFVFFGFYPIVKPW